MNLKPEKLATFFLFQWFGSFINTLHLIRFAHL